jgi:hypothetical protein
VRPAQGQCTRNYACEHASSQARSDEAGVREPRWGSHSSNSINPVKKLIAFQRFDDLKWARPVSHFRRRSQSGSPYMSLESHLVELERRHQAMENAIADEKTHPATDGLKLIELKRKKLLLKDEIEKLRQEKLLATTH